jgi:hypothetical protein
MPLGENCRRTRAGAPAPVPSSVSSAALIG